MFIILREKLNTSPTIPLQTWHSEIFRSQTKEWHKICSFKKTNCVHVPVFSSTVCRWCNICTLYINLLLFLSQTSVWCCRALRRRAASLRVSLLCRQASATAPASPHLSPDRLHTHPIRCQVSLETHAIKHLNVKCFTRHSHLNLVFFAQCVKRFCLHFSSLWFSV